MADTLADFPTFDPTVGTELSKETPVAPAVPVSNPMPVVQQPAPTPAMNQPVGNVGPAPVNNKPRYTNEQSYQVLLNGREETVMHMATNEQGQTVVWFEPSTVAKFYHDRTTQKLIVRVTKGKEELYNKSFAYKVEKFNIQNVLSVTNWILNMVANGELPKIDKLYIFSNVAHYAIKQGTGKTPESQKFIDSINTIRNKLNVKLITRSKEKNVWYTI